LRFYPGTTYDLLDIWTPTNIYPFCTLVKSYKHLSANPRQWKWLYHISNSRPYEIFTDVTSILTCRNKVRSYIEKYDPDVVVSVHPTMNYLPVRATRKIARRKNKYIPFFTVVTDFGSAHCTWFQGNVDKMYVASQRIRRLARRRSTISDEKLIMSGLPIRHDFAVQANKMGGERTSQKANIYRRQMKQELGLNPNKKMVLVMGGGEGVGSLSEIAKGLYTNLKKQGIDATICVVCGRNEKLRDELNNKNWDEEDTTTKKKKKRKRKRIPGFFRSKRIQQALDEAHNEKSNQNPGDVNVVGLGFVTQMAEYMVAADVLVTKAGPGTIAEAAAVGLPVMITSFLPGQEAGNVNIVLDGGFGDFCVDPDDIGNEVSCWLNDDDLMKEMSRKSTAVGHPDAASEIVQDIGQITHEWMIKNKQNC
jgi:1,2-diacylglycerol 3-beta-galactosyltransferase